MRNPLSEKIVTIQPSGIRRFFDIVSEMEGAISLGVGEPDFDTPWHIREEGIYSLEKGRTFYTSNSGLKGLKEEICNDLKRRCDLTYDPEHEVLVTVGGSEAIDIALRAMLDPGDEVLIPDPGYPTYTAINKILGTKIRYYDLREDNGWQPDFDALERMDLSRVKLMWTNYPNMPTGGNARMETYERLVDFARRHDIVIVNDNPYSLILNDRPLSILQVPGAKDRCLEFNSMSKSHNMPGWRVAMVASNPTFISWILKVKSNIDNGSFRGIQLAAAEAFTTNTDEWHQENNIANYRRRRDIAERIMRTLGCEYDPGQVGMFLWGKIPDKYADVEQLTERALHEARVFITPGFIFGRNGKRYVRVSLCAKDERMLEALRRLRALEW